MKKVPGRTLCRCHGWHAAVVALAGAASLLLLLLFGQVTCMSWHLLLSAAGCQYVLEKDTAAQKQKIRQTNPPIVKGLMSLRGISD